MWLLKAEAHERDTTVKEVLSRALEAYFAERLETKAFAKLAESSFREWDDPRDGLRPHVKAGDVALSGFGSRTSTARRSAPRWC